MNTAKLLSVGEHAHYPFKSYPKQQCDTILFPGCAFPSQFPRTMDKLSQVCREAGFGVAYDCCGDPVESYGEHKSAARILRNLQRRFDALGCKRVVVLCPSCTKHLTGKLDCEVVHLFSILDELGLEGTEFGTGSLFIPCPDKKMRTTEGHLRQQCDLSAVKTMEKIGCCGLRADLASKGPEYVSSCSGKIIERSKEEGGVLYTYCASCLGQFSRMGYDNCRHPVSVILGVDEAPDSGNAFMNRAKRKLDRNTNPVVPAMAAGEGVRK
ncbi:MAG: (Fe-S)-binding protein [Eggerthellaceae bacterium]|nr:(Fe-S)-binding protein [Eggerthellaceae bacterium]